MTFCFTADEHLGDLVVESPEVFRKALIKSLPFRHLALNQSSQQLGGESVKTETNSPMLDPKEERCLWGKIAEGDDDAREYIILAYRPMVFWLAKKFRVPYNAYPDLIQEGMVGLIAAVDNFDISRKNRFITYAYYKVRGRMANFLQRSEARAPLPVDEECLERGGNSIEGEIERMEWSLAIKESINNLRRK